jgi:hypothetical protein
MTATLSYFSQLNPAQVESLVDQALAYLESDIQAKDVRIDHAPHEPESVYIEIDRPWYKGSDLKYKLQCTQSECKIFQPILAAGCSPNEDWHCRGSFVPDFEFKEFFDYQTAAEHQFISYLPISAAVGALWLENLQVYTREVVEFVGVSSMYENQVTIRFIEQGDQQGEACTAQAIAYKRGGVIDVCITPELMSKMEDSAAFNEFMFLPVLVHELSHALFFPIGGRAEEGFAEYVRYHLLYNRILTEEEPKHASILFDADFLPKDSIRPVLEGFSESLDEFVVGNYHGESVWFSYQLNLNYRAQKSLNHLPRSTPISVGVALNKFYELHDTIIYAQLNPDGKLKVSFFQNPNDVLHSGQVPSCSVDSFSFPSYTTPTIIEGELVTVIQKGSPEITHLTQDGFSRPVKSGLAYKSAFCFWEHVGHETVRGVKQEALDYSLQDPTRKDISILPLSDLLTKGSGWVSDDILPFASLFGINTFSGEARIYPYCRDEQE